jgi:hypothetical protein
MTLIRQKLTAETQRKAEIGVKLLTAKGAKEGEGIPEVHAKLG